MKRAAKNEYRQLEIKLFVKTILMIVISFLILQGGYVILGGRVANATVSILKSVFHMDDAAALEWYQHVIRNNKNLIIFAAILIVFFIIFIIYLKWFSKYFYQINRGIDALISENGSEIVLLPELSATERKLNSVRRTMEKQKMDAQLAEQKKNDLVVYLAHDLKTPLTSVIGYLTLLRDENKISDELREKYLSISLEKAERLEDLINEFFEITRFNLSNIALEYSTVNVTRMLEQLVYEFNPMLAEKNLNCNLHAAPNLLMRCDSNKMQRVLDNLLRNAVNYSYKDSAIEITVTQDENKTQLAFKNQGNTIPKEKLERIFEQFYRLDTARVSKNGGAGLGLAIAKQIVELHNGFITANSENGFTVFQVSIPLS